jgi:hypothetical protein
VAAFGRKPNPSIPADLIACRDAAAVAVLFEDGQNAFITTINRGWHGHPARWSRGKKCPGFDNFVLENSLTAGRAWLIMQTQLNATN